MYSGDDRYPPPSGLRLRTGIPIQAPRFTGGRESYYMNYRDQLVSTGLVNDGGDALNINVPTATAAVSNSRLHGAPSTGSRGGQRDLLAEPHRGLRRPSDVYDNPTTGTRSANATSTWVPRRSLLAFDDRQRLLRFHYRGFEATLHTQYVSKQYFTNTRSMRCRSTLLRDEPQSGLYAAHASARSVRLGWRLQLFNANTATTATVTAAISSRTARAPTRRSTSAGAVERTGERDGKILNGWTGNSRSNSRALRRSALLWLEYRANIWLWVVGLVMPMVHAVLYYKSGLYAIAR